MAKVNFTKHVEFVMTLNQAEAKNLLAVLKALPVGHSTDDIFDALNNATMDAN